MQSAVLNLKKLLKHTFRVQKLAPAAINVFRLILEILLKSNLPNVVQKECVRNFRNTQHPFKHHGTLNKYMILLLSTSKNSSPTPKIISFQFLILGYCAPRMYVHELLG